jgi:hypothetical protein
VRDPFVRQILEEGPEVVVGLLVVGVAADALEVLRDLRPIPRRYPDDVADRIHHQRPRKVRNHVEARTARALREQLHGPRAEVGFEPLHLLRRERILDDGAELRVTWGIGFEEDVRVVLPVVGEALPIGERRHDVLVVEERPEVALLVVVDGTLAAKLPVERVRSVGVGVQERVVADRHPRVTSASALSIAASVSSTSSRV